MMSSSHCSSSDSKCVVVWMDGVFVCGGVGVGDGCDDGVGEVGGLVCGGVEGGDGCDDGVGEVGGLYGSVGGSSCDGGGSGSGAGSWCTSVSMCLFSSVCTSHSMSESSSLSMSKVVSAILSASSARIVAGSPPCASMAFIFL